jgi:hypothetical protein
MKITKSQLRRIIKEELESVLNDKNVNELFGFGKKKKAAAAQGQGTEKLAAVEKMAPVFYKALRSTANYVQKVGPEKIKQDLGPLMKDKDKFNMSFQGYLEPSSGDMFRSARAIAEVFDGLNKGTIEVPQDKITLVVAAGEAAAKFLSANTPEKRLQWLLGFEDYAAAAEKFGQMFQGAHRD